MENLNTQPGQAATGTVTDAAVPASAAAATPAAADATAVSRALPRAGLATDSTPHCACGTPQHPDHVEKRHGITLERYDCPRRRWWNAWQHPHSWMPPRDPVTHHHP
ncbi:MAG: hypothetical protein JO306_08040 [Gemmatimonadetes bacterium]|nr:hypothetical protein [Gemmatimonadota bacterium]